MAQAKTVATKRYIVAFTYVWAHGDGAVISYFEISKKHYNMLKVNHGKTVLDIDYEQPWAQFHAVVIDGIEIDLDEGEKRFKFGDEGVLATFDGLAAVFKAVAGDNVKFIEVIELTE